MIDDIELALIRNIIRFLKKDMRNHARWQAEKLRDLGRLETINRDTVIRLMPDAIEKVYNDLQKNIERGARSVDRFAGSLVDLLPAEASPKLQMVYAGWYRKTGQNLNRMAGSMLNSASALYVDTVERVTAQTLLGATSVRDAVRETCYQWAEDGIKGFRDKAGREWTAEAYSQTLIRTTSANARREASFARMEDLDIDLILVSSHLDARPGCEPYQGQVLSLNGKTPGYLALYDTTYGEPDGLFGINCRHTHTPFAEGMANTATQYDPEEAEEAYKKSQMQRHLERTIRQEKKLLAVAKELGDREGVEKYSGRLAIREKKLEEFIGSTGRTRRTDREEVYGR